MLLREMYEREVAPVVVGDQNTFIREYRAHAHVGGCATRTVEWCFDCSAPKTPTNFWKRDELHLLLPSL